MYGFLLAGSSLSTESMISCADIYISTIHLSKVLAILYIASAIGLHFLFHIYASVVLGVDT